MKIDSPLESLELDLTCIEFELKKYCPPTCKNEAIILDLLDKREQYKYAIFHLKSLQQIHDICHGLG